MFQGSLNVAKNEHGKLIDNAGGRWNASTGKDRTNYYETVPSHFLDLVLWLEADRMESLDISHENFENQRKTVIEEKKQSYDNHPYGLAQLRFDELAYENWAYAHPIVGSVEDLLEVQLEDARTFHRVNYGPGNATLVLAGDINLAAAGLKVEQYFGEIGDRTSVCLPNLDEPPQQGQKAETMRDPLAVLPAVTLGYHMPALGTPAHYALSILALILGDGDSSRFYRRFVYENNWIAGLFAGPNQYRGPQLFRLWFQIQRGLAPEDLVTAVDEEIDRIKQEGITEEELEKARNQLAHRFVARLARVAQVGELLAHYASYFGEPERINTQLNDYLSISKEDIRTAAQTYLKADNRTLIIVEPTPPS